MADLLLDSTYDRFTVMYDIALLISEGVRSESALTSAVHLSSGDVSQLASFMINQGYVRTAGSGGEFRITTLGSTFLEEFQGMRRFLS